MENEGEKNRKEDRIQEGERTHLTDLSHVLQR